MINLLSQISSSVEILLQTSKLKHNNDHIEYFWNFLNPLTRLVLLNQTEMLKLPFNVTEQIIQSDYNLNWQKLPLSVQSLLLNQQGSSLLFLTFEQWGWVQSGNKFAAATFYSILPVEIKQILPRLFLILAPIQYDLQVSMTALDDVLQVTSNDKRLKKKLSEIFIDSFFENVKELISIGLKKKTFRRFYRQPTASIVVNALYRAQCFLRSTGLFDNFL